MPENEAAPRRPCVLVVDDEPAVADAVVYALRTDGCEPRRAATGGEALACLATNEVALVVLDLGLPDVQGFDLLREIRSRWDLPVILLTARSQEVDRIVGLEMGADDYIVKPFSPREVSARVRTVLRRCRKDPAREPERSAGAALPFVVDEERRAIAYFGTPLDLTRSEYRLLRALLRHPGWVLSRAQLQDALWEDAGASTDRAVDSHVKALRAKLRAVRPEIEAIETRRGEGYALRERW